MVGKPINRRHLLLILGALSAGEFSRAFAADSAATPSQPYFANIRRALDTLATLGAPIASQDAQRISELAGDAGPSAISEVDRMLDRYTLLHVTTEMDGYAHVRAGGAERTLIEQGWRVFLLRVSNLIGSTSKLNMLGPAQPWIRTNTGPPRVEIPDPWNTASYIAQSWLTAQLYETAPMATGLSGLAIEYKIIQLHSRDRGQRSQQFDFDTVFDTVGWEASVAAKLQHRRGATLDFTCLPSRDVILRIRDADGLGCVASITIKDQFGRIYPLQGMRIAPDMNFQRHVYRADLETVRLPQGEYTIESKRGPEYLRNAQTVKVRDATGEIGIQLKRWIDPGKWGWYSGDVHIHASGCAHYQRPTEGVSPETMIRHTRGEGLSIGNVLTWGPSWYYQKQFFTGHAVSPVAELEHPELQVANNTSLRPRATPKDAESLLRYDVEVSGFPSSHCGHLILLRLKDVDFPGTKLIEEWPSWNLPVLRWAKAQGAVVGYAHCGLGMVVDSQDLPNYDIPPMDGVGTQEAIVDVTYGLVDFIAGCDTPPVAELNAWYHMLNCGFRLALVGETDYPCITDERPGVGRTYVNLKQRPVDDFGYEAWVRNLQRGRLYCGDGRSHFLEFTVNGHRNGDKDLLIDLSEDVIISTLVAARLEPAMPADMESIRRTFLNGWHLERSRIGVTREVPLELIINGSVTQKATLIADGKPRTVTFTARIERSSWIALRIFPSSHTYPVFVQVGGRPIRASRRSAQWCRACIDKLWEVKAPFIRESERPSALDAFDQARKAYGQILGECQIE